MRDKIVHIFSVKPKKDAVRSDIVVFFEENGVYAA